MFTTRRAGEVAQKHACLLEPCHGDICRPNGPRGAAPKRHAVDMPSSLIILWIPGPSRSPARNLGTEFARINIPCHGEMFRPDGPRGAAPQRHAVKMPACSCTCGPANNRFWLEWREPANISEQPRKLSICHSRFGRHAHFWSSPFLKPWGFGHDFKPGGHAGANKTCSAPKPNPYQGRLQPA